MSEYYFIYAFNINLKLSVLYCYVGMVKYVLNDNDVVLLFFF